MAVTISLNDVFTFILLVAGITLLVYLVITVGNINSVLKEIKYTLRKNVDVFNAVVENKEKYTQKWERELSNEDILTRVTAKRFIQIFTKAKPIDDFDEDLYFKLVEKIMVHEAGTLIVSLLDGSEFECRFE